jgi:hypothetical protein
VVNAVALANFKDSFYQGRLSHLTHVALNPVSGLNLVSGYLLVLSCQHAVTFLAELSFELLIMARMKKWYTSALRKEETSVTQAQRDSNMVGTGQIPLR